MIEQQISDTPLSPPTSPIKEQPSQEDHESSSPSETTKVVIEEKTQSQEEYESSSQTIVATTEEDNQLTLTPPTVEETSPSEEVIVKSENPTNEDTTSVTEDDIKEGSSLDNIEAAQLEIAKILNNSDNNNNNSTINVEDKTDLQTEKELPSSPLLTYVAYDDKLDSLQTLAASQEVMAAMPLHHLEYEVIHATTWDDNYPPEQLLPKTKGSSNGEIKYGKGWQSERHCKYPQEIILQVSCGSARIRRLQILSHHHKIATKLEIYVGSVQRRKDLVGVNTNTGSSHDDKRILSWDKFPKIIENDGIESEDEGSNSEENDYDIIRSNNEPYILFRRLGYCALDSNERSSYRARELKSVRLDTEGEYIRLVARHCYENHHNQYNQVGIVGITVTGEPVDHLLAGESQTIPIEHDEGVSRVASPETCIVPFIQENNWLINNDPNDQRNFTSLCSILPKSLSASNNNSSTTTNPLPNDAQTNINNPIIANDFLLNGEETEKLLAAFGRAKQNAVKVEDFHLAKVLKFFTELVTKAAEDVCKYDVLKKQAVEEEDFDNADKYKQEIECIRLEIRSSLADEGIDLDESGEVIIQDLQDIIGLADTENTLENQQSDPNVNEDFLLATSSHIPKSRSNSNASIDRASGARAPEPILPLIPKSRTNSDASINRYLGGNNNNNCAYERQEEPTTPTTPTHSTTPLPWTPFVDDRNSSSTEVMMAHIPQNLAENEPEPLTKLARTAFALSITFFGDHVIACLLSTKYHLRDSALIQVTNRIDIDADGLSVDGIDRAALVRATYQVIQEALNDNRDEYTLQVLILWRKLIKFCVHHQIPNVSTWKWVEVNYELLFGKTSNTNEHVKQRSIDLFILLAKTYKTPTQSVLSLILKPAKTQSQPLKKAKPTVELIIRLIEEFGVVQIQKIKFDKDNKLSLAALMEVSVSYLNNNNEEVRIAAVKLVFEIVKRIGRENVEPYLAEGEVEPSILETILTLITEWEETAGKVAGEVPSPPPSPKQPSKELTEKGKDVLQQPLAKRGTVDRIEQELEEVKFRMNNTNNMDYLANAKKAFEQVEIDEEEELRLEAQLIAEIEEIEALEAESKDEPSPKVKNTVASKKVPTARGSKSAAPSKSAPAKKPKDDGKAAPSKKTSTSKTSAARSVSRRGSADDVKLPSKSARKNSINNPNVPSKLTSEPVTDEPDELKSDKHCIFCDEHDERYTEENLVTHYWNDCPVLTNCRLCNIILEISTLDDHMLNDCDKSKFVKQCPRCREVIGADDYLEHMAKQSCMAIRQDIVRCPLCKATVKPATEAGWKTHLIDENGCTKNRRKSKSSTSMVKEMEAAATAEKREKKSTSVTKSSATSKTPARKPTAASKDKPKKASTAKVSKAKK